MAHTSVTGHGGRDHQRSHTRSMSPPRSVDGEDGDRHRDRDRSRRHRHRSRSRFRSPADRHDFKRHHHHHHRHRHHRSHDDREREGRRRRPHSRSDTSPSTPAPAAAVTLPFGARQLSKRDLPVLEPMFAMYLDIQKGLVLEDLDEEEVKGRWKSFVKRWNRGELAEGWYDPGTFERAKNAAQLPSASAGRSRRESADYGVGGEGRATWSQSRSRSRSHAEPEKREEGQVSRRDTEEMREDRYEDEDEDEELYGPQLPGEVTASRSQPLGQRFGPTIPTMQDLELRRESALEDAESARETAQKQRRFELQSHKAEMRVIHDEIAPRAEPGTHERRLEKRHEAAAANREFAERSRRGGSPIEALPDSDLMGGGMNDDLEALKKVREREKRKKNEREIRREEILRARAAERDQRLKKYQEKEEETMGWLKALAKQRFG